MGWELRQQTFVLLCQTWVLKSPTISAWRANGILYEASLVKFQTLNAPTNLQEAVIVFMEWAIDGKDKPNWI